MPNKTSKKSAEVSRKAAAAKPRKAVAKSSAREPTNAARPTLLAGGNPQIAKADGDAPVQAFIAAMLGFKHDIGRRLDALDQLQEFEQRCREETHAFLSLAPDDLTAALALFNDLFRRLYLFSCCHWGCHGKEHLFEYLAGRCVSSLASGWRLAETGYYDEALSLVRSVGEIANLLNLFWCNDREIRNWLDLPERERRYRPAGVRDQLRELNWMVPFDDEHYGRLCELAVHPTPATKPNAHHDSQRPVLGAYFQPEGFSLAAWELCWALSVVAGPIAKLAIFPESESKAMVEVTVTLLKLTAGHVP